GRGELPIRVRRPRRWAYRSRARRPGDVDGRSLDRGPLRVPDGDRDRRASTGADRGRDARGRSDHSRRRGVEQDPGPVDPDVSADIRAEAGWIDPVLTEREDVRPEVQHIIDGVLEDRALRPLTKCDGLRSDGPGRVIDDRVQRLVVVALVVLPGRRRIPAVEETLDVSGFDVSRQGPPEDPHVVG